jgi:flagellar FliL protein
MPVEQRVVATPPTKIGGKIGGGAAPAGTAEPDAPKRSRKRLVILVVAALVVVGGGGYVAKDRFLGHATATSSAHPSATPTPKPGAVVQVDPVSLNLAGGHYLRLGLALQLTAKAKEEPDTSRALDAAIALFSGRSVAEVSTPATREKLKAQLADELATTYDGEVMGVYLTTYVTQ